MQKIIRVLQPGLLSTIQDLGRTGYQHIALSRGGAMDWRQMILANRLVGNSDSEAGIEITGFGPTLHFPDETLIACTGAPFSVSIRNTKGDRDSLPTHRPVLIKADSIVQWHHAIQGFRCWLAIAGGLRYPEILQSQSSHLAARIGEPALTRGAAIPVGEVSQDRIKKAIPEAFRPLASLYSASRWRLRSSIPKTWPSIHLPVLEGRHLKFLSAIQKNQLLDTTWHISPRSNRQGIRLHGSPVILADIPHILSEPVRQGTVQLPPDGIPILMSCEHQTTGGYPRVLEIPGCFTPLLAQASPDSQIHFKFIDLEEADHAAMKMDQEFEIIKQSIFDRLHP